jgi:GntR family transcriptional regulator, transcriptional repressor for pyruvate dehydrogenase complex
VVKKTNSKRQPNLTESLISDMRVQITSGKLKPGDKLPTEQKLVEIYGVSRTVVREAIAGLRADGLMESRHGVGVFVLVPPKKSDDFRFLGEDPGRASSVVETLELRAAVEIEAATIAAQRRSPGQEARIRDCFQDTLEANEGDRIAAASDFAFHIAIAEATNNPRFVEFLEYLGLRAMPRSQIERAHESDADAVRRDQRLHGEHRAILEAISQRDSVAAGEAMREHLKGSQDRYTRLIYSSR